MTDLLVLPLMVYVGFALYAWFFADRQIFLPQPSSYRDDGRYLEVRTPDGETLRARHLPNPEASHTVLFSHGNAEDLGQLEETLEEIRDLGYAVFAYDYRGYGLSTGRPTVKGACLDIEAAYAYLTGPLGVRPEQVVPFGRSVGGGPSIHLATRAPVGGLILQSTFTSAFVVVTRVPLLPFDRFRNLAGMRRVGCPVLVMHGKADRIIPFAHGLRLHGCAPEPRQHLWLEGVGHNDFPGPHAELYRKAVREFRRLLDGTRPPEAAGQPH